MSGQGVFWEHVCGCRTEDGVFMPCADHAIPDYLPLIDDRPHHDLCFREGPCGPDCPVEIRRP